jgi:NAD(P)-dependent dehydrogenase (short-subunit alcohol dehydrogenase family)
MGGVDDAGQAGPHAGQAGQAEPQGGTAEPQGGTAEPQGGTAEPQADQAGPQAVQAVVITGGTRGIGAGIARGFLRAGAQVLVCGRTEPAQPPSASGRSAAFVRADVRDPEQAGQLAAAARERFGRIDVMISNAGGSPYAAAATASPRFHAKVIELNLVAPLHVAQAANIVMQDQPGGGSIIFIGSVSGTRPSPGTAAYGAAKAGLHHLATSLAIEWGPKVRVNSVVPGFVAADGADDHYGDAAGMAAVAATVPLRRMATPDDIADACLFLASPQAAYVSGAALTLHGGGEAPAFLAAVRGSVYAPRD